jgi:hypothetical protein
MVDALGLLILLLLGQPGEACLSHVEVGTTLRVLATDKTRNLLFSICEYELVSEPTWDPGRGIHPPLSLARAIDLSRGSLPQYLEDPSSWDVSEVTVRSLGQQRWAYLVTWKGVDSSIKLPVLFSGRVVKGVPSSDALDRSCKQATPSD